ncbi:MAG: HAD-IA family hydrolase [Thermoanaerobaculia bacterium]|nr:HAD-IA family hydrolase [Thermoanaerobaculia bacterium]
MGVGRPGPYELLVFDWDGTLIDSISTIVACTRATLAEMGRPALPEQRIRDGIGMGLKQAVENLEPGHDEAFFDEIRRVFRRLWLETYNHRPVLFDGVAEMLARLHGDGYRLAVATAKGREGLEMDFERTGVRRWFATSRTFTEAPGKPNPEMLRQILEETGYSAARTLVVGDSEHDMGMAVNAGADAVGVASGSQPPAVLFRAGALKVLPRVVELPAWLESRIP